MTATDDEITPMSAEEHFTHYQDARRRYRASSHGLGYIYAIRRRDLHEIKIGFAADPLVRLAVLQTAHARPLEIAFLFATRSAAADEAKIHRRFAGYRLLGEWFVASPEIEAWIAGGHPNAVSPRQLAGMTPERSHTQCGMPARAFGGRACMNRGHIPIRNANTGDQRHVCHAHASSVGWEMVSP